MGIYLGSNQIDNINTINISNINTDIEDQIIQRTISQYFNNIISKVRIYAFYSCYNLTSIDLPQATIIGSYAFYDCYNLVSINLPQATTIGNYTFYDCYRLTSINLPQTTTISNNAFAYCTSLTSISLPQATTISSYAFAACESLVSIDLPQVTIIGDNAFVGCESLTSINLPQVVSIGNYAFEGCFNLTSTNLPQVISIGNAIFRSCYSLASINLLQIARIGESAFGNCYNLLSLYLLGSSIPFLDNINAFDSTPMSDYTTSTGGVYGSIYVPASLYSSYITAENWSTYSARIVSTNIVYNGSYEVYHESYMANNINYVNVPNVTTISPDVLYIEINGIKYECSKQDVSSDYGYSAYAYGYYGVTDQWSSDDYPFSLVFSNGEDSLAILSSVAEAGDYISLTVFYT